MTKGKHVDVGDCEHIREQVHENDVHPSVVAEDYELTSQAVRYHAYGECIHPGDTPDPDPDKFVPKYHDPEWLREQLEEKVRSVSELADECGISETTIKNHARDNGIEPRPYRDGEWLRRKHHDEELSTQGIADLCDVTRQTVSHWMGRKEVEQRDKHQNKDSKGLARKNIKVSAEAFEQLKGEKPDGVSWDYYLTEIRTVE